MRLSGEWFDKLPADERARVASVIGEVFVVEEIDEYGSPWICKNWPNAAEGTSMSHSVALDASKMECLGEASHNESAV